MLYIWVVLLNVVFWFFNIFLFFKNWLILLIEIFCGWFKCKNWYFNVGFWVKCFVFIVCLILLKLVFVYLFGICCICGLYCKLVCIWVIWFNVIFVWLYLINFLVKLVDLIYVNLLLDNLL